MAFLQRGNNIEPRVSDILYHRKVYNFTYRLSGNTGIAEILTEKVFLRCPANHKDDVILLKQAWERFLKYYGGLDLTGEDTVQQALLSLPPEIRCAIILRDILGYSYKQVASVLNKSELAAGNLISLGRRKITECGIRPNIS